MASKKMILLHRSWTDGRGDNGRTARRAATDGRCDEIFHETFVKLSSGCTYQYIYKCVNIYDYAHKMTWRKAGAAFDPRRIPAL